MTFDSKTHITEIIPTPIKITEYKLKGPNYLEWSWKIRIYLQSVDKDDHLTEDPSIDDTR